MDDAAKRIGNEGDANTGGNDKESGNKANS